MEHTLNQQRDKVLLTHHAKLGIWIQLGGHCEGIKDPFFTALREAYEESGLKRIDALSQDILDIDIHTFPKKGTEPAHLHYDLRYLFEADDHQELVTSSESHDLRWIALDALEEFGTDQSVLQMRERIASLI